MDFKNYTLSEPTPAQGWKKCETSLEYGQKCEFFTNFQKFWEEKDQNIHPGP